MQQVAGAVGEVEVKYRVDDVAALVAALDARGVVLSPPVVQDDQAYAPAWWRYHHSRIGVPFARLRTQDGRHVFTVKTPVANEQACVEQETTVADRDQMHAALLAMGFQATVRIVKTRRTAQMGPLAVCLDHVEHAGVFLEVERIVVADDVAEHVQDDLAVFVAGLGVPVRRVSDTYDTLVRAAHPTAGGAVTGPA